MLYALFSNLSETYRAFAVFDYLTLRAMLACVTALLLGLAAGPRMIRYLRRLKIGQAVRDDGPQSHMVKQGTPTMGGALILLAIGVSTLLWADLSNRFVWVVMLVTMGLGVLGWVDDYRKVVYRDPQGMRSKEKFFWQALIGAVAALYLSVAISVPDNMAMWPFVKSWFSTGFYLPERADLIVPFFKHISYPLGLFGFVLLSWLVIVGASNAVNLTDGLDGLAIMPTVLIGGALGIFAYVVGRVDFSSYLLFPYIPGAAELLILSAALGGAGLAFLWFNVHPAQVFMGDVGSLALGGMLGTMAIIVRQEIVFFVMSGVFVVETLSVMAQVLWYRYTKKRHGTPKRLFKMAPLHHHFELKGWAETQVVVRFWIITILLVLLGLATLKLR